MLSRLAVTSQLGGEIQRDWYPEGLAIRLTAPRSRLTSWSDAKHRVSKDAIEGADAAPGGSACAIGGRRGTGVGALGTAFFIASSNIAMSFLQGEF